MTKDTITNEVTHDRTDAKGTFKEISEAIEKAQSQEDLTELYKQSVYMILLTHSSPLDQKEQELKRRQEIAEEEFPRTVRMINKQAEKLGLEASYDEDWEKMAANGYETEGENILEAQNTDEINRE
ncbi:MAG TPA: hypothetical protein VK206_07005 [Anaerolineales bacterium]|nr:hypothetical protein [Anaerolineales bacterium]